MQRKLPCDLLSIWKLKISFPNGVYWIDLYNLFISEDAFNIWMSENGGLAFNNWNIL